VAGFDRPSITDRLTRAGGWGRAGGRGRRRALPRSERRGDGASRL